MMHVSPDFIAICVFACVALLDRFGFLDRFKRKTAAEAASELEIQSRTIERLSDENVRLRELTDITPIVEALDRVTRGLHDTAEVNRETLMKVRDMNGSLRAHSQAMRALADRLVLDEAARALLAAASKRPS